MTQIDLISNEWSELVFENRNRTYGAYVLRMQTGARNLASILIVLVALGVVMALITAFNAYENYRKEHIAYDQVVEITALSNKEIKPKVERPQPIKQEDVQEVVERVRSSIKFVAPVIKNDNEVNPEDEIKTQDEIMNSKAAISFANVVGNDENGQVLHAKQVLADEPVRPAEDTKVHEFVEQMPSFPGGTTELMRWLASHIKYPVVAEENGIQGRVTCTFVVGKDGTISNIQVVRGVDPSLDKEAVRVISSMPKWIPGRQNGSSVNVKYTLPVTFRLN